MDKKDLYRLWMRIRPIKVWYIAILLAVSIGITAVALRQNNLGMVKLREAVYQADKDDGDVEAALQQLRAYVHSHMNTSLSSGDSAVYPPIQLKHTYQRLRQAEHTRVQQASAKVYTDAQAHCEKLHPGSFSGGPRVPCIEQYIAEKGIKERDIPAALYKFDFVSPTWSPDIAGFGVLCSLLLLAALIVRIALGSILKSAARRQQQ